MLYITVTDEGGFREFWVDEQHTNVVLASLGLVSGNMDIADAVELART